MRAAPAPTPSRSAGPAASRHDPVFDADEDEDFAIDAAPAGARAPRFSLPPLAFPAAELPPAAPRVDLAPLRIVLQDLIACREMLDAAMRDG